MENQKYYSIDGKEVSLRWLVINEPEWAENRLRYYESLQARLSRAEGCLREIAEHPNCDEQNCWMSVPHNGPMEDSYWISGCVYGHREAAAIARRYWEEGE